MWVPYSKNFARDIKSLTSRFLETTMRASCALCAFAPRLTPFLQAGRAPHQRWLIALVVALSCVPISPAQAVELSMHLSTNGLFGQSQLDAQLRTPEQRAKIRTRAEAGSARDQFLVGYAYSRGLGQPQDMESALAWYLKAANHTEPAAITELGRMYVHGIGVSQDYQKGMEWIRRAAAEGYAPAQTDIGLLYFQGLGISRSYESAIRWWEQAEGQGYAPAESNLGVAYLNGIGVSRDTTRAAHLFRVAADAGLDTAQFDLGSCYEEGQGVPQDFNIAAEWYQKAAQQGHAGAQNNLASLYQAGHGVPQDTVRALRLFLLAAGNGNLKAAINLARVFHLGLGVKPDPALSYMWLKVASDGGEDVTEALSIAAAEITDQQMNQARQQASAWRAQHHLDPVPTMLTSAGSPESR
jgi:uncharacterized protein